MSQSKVSDLPVHIVNIANLMYLMWDLEYIIKHLASAYYIMIIITILIPL